MTSSLPINAVHHISHITHDLEASRRFYREVLGFAEIERSEPSEAVAAGQLTDFRDAEERGRRA